MGGHGLGGRKGDILFLGVERPSDNQPEATKILSSSQLVQTLATRLIVDTELLKVLEHDTTFLLSQLKPARLEICCSVLNFIRITETSPTVSLPCLLLLLSLQTWSYS